MKALALALLLAACGGSKSNQAAEPAPANTEPAPATSDGTDGSGGSATDGVAPAPGSCEALGGRCTNMAAAVVCGSQPQANNCGQNEFCCVM